MHSVSQGEGIKQALARRPVKVVAITSGKGGVGKTNVATNLAVALSNRRRKVMLLDADLGLANIDVLLGLQPRFNLSHVISGEADLASTIINGPAGVQIVPAASGNFSMTDVPPASQAAIVQAFSDLGEQPDVLIVDTAAGISESVARFVQAAQQAIIVVCDEPSSITDAYALIKVFSRHYGISRFQVLTNQTRDARHGQDLYTKIRKVADRYLDVVLRHVGNVPHDQYLRRAVQEQRAVVDAYPASIAGEAFQRIAQTVDELPTARGPQGGIEFFFEQLLHAETACVGSMA
ncbi:MinD/ParA family protein [Woeseia oceani]|uniref:Cobyrinic acid a,c-diamide synthase n=1 Tax=Woeseia oceani TaxID=1548547 RepID=A0A193LF27_9GAMM|nr:MinD/ParA family protein [Woeseia oceani]ANO51061.1 cobyrinic acid a,c-diamide synthase [Woeseia oceani]